MHNMFLKKGVKTIEKPYVLEPKVVDPLVHVVDVNIVTTLTLSLRPRQGLIKVWAKNEARESHFMLS